MMDSRGELKGELLPEVLKSDRQAMLAVTGSSILPTIWPGDFVEVRREIVAEISLGDVVFCARQGGFSAHCVVRKMAGPERPVLITRGDALIVPDPPVGPKELLGACHRRLARRAPTRAAPHRLAPAGLMGVVSLGDLHVAGAAPSPALEILNSKIRCK